MMFSDDNNSPLTMPAKSLAQQKADAIFDQVCRRKKMSSQRLKTEPVSQVVAWVREVRPDLVIESPALAMMLKAYN